MTNKILYSLKNLSATVKAMPACETTRRASALYAHIQSNAKLVLWCVVLPAGGIPCASSVCLGRPKTGTEVTPAAPVEHKPHGKVDAGGIELLSVLSCCLRACLSL